MFRVSIDLCNRGMNDVKKAACARLLLLVPGMLMAISMAIANHSDQQDASKLVLGVHPYLPANELKKRFGPLADYLGKQLKKKVILHISKDYESHIEHVGNNTLDIAYMGPSSYVTLSQKYGRHPLLARLEVNGKPYLYGVIITNKNTKLKNIEQLIGKRFAFGSPQSTMSYLVPRHMLIDKGVTLEHLAEFKFLGNHRNVALGVLLGEFDAGAIKIDVFHKFKDRGLVVLATSPAISEHLFVTRKNLSKNEINKIRKLLFSLSKTEEGLAILKSIKSSITGLVSVKHSDYKTLEQIMTKHGPGVN